MTADGLKANDITKLSAEERRQLLQKLLVKKAAQSKQYPLSMAQKRMWMISEIVPNSEAYNTLNCFRIHGPLKPDLLKKSINRIVVRHESLRTVFRKRGKEPVQVVLPELELDLSLRDLSDLPAPSRLSEGHEISRAFVVEPFNLEKGPLIRTMLLKLDDEDHVLMVSAHHIAFDILSMKVFNKELGTIYECHSNGKQDTLSPLTFHYKEFSQWEKKALKSSVMDRQLEYWKDNLAELEITEVPSFGKRPPVQRFKGELINFQVPEKVVERMLAIGLANKASPYMCWLAVLQLLLHRYTGNTDISVSSPIGNRGNPEAEKLIGCFVNTLVMRVDFSGQPDFVELLARVRRTTINAYQNADVSFGRVVEALAPERDRSRNPISQIMLQIGSLPLLKMPGLKVDNIWEIDLGLVRGDLEFFVAERKSGDQHITMVYNTDLYTQEQMALLARHYVNLAAAIAAGADARLGLHTMLTQEELIDQDRFNDNGADYPETTLHARFEETAARWPNHIAVQDDKTSLSYDQLNRKANRVAHYLLAQGVVIDQRVGLMAENSIDLMVGLLGILKAGGAYVPLDTRYPEERLMVMAEQGEVDILIGRSEMFHTLPDSLKHRFDPWQENALDGYSEDNPLARGLPDSLAYLNFTSGSTGQPKASNMSHRNALRFMMDNRYLEIGPGDSVALIASSSWDVFGFETWTTFLGGARLCIFDMDKLLSVDAFAHWAQQWNITLAIITSPLLARHVAAKPDIYKGIRYVLTGGDKVDPSAARIALEHSRPEVLYNSYGPTECATYTLFHPISLEDVENGDLPLGRPVANALGYVMDADYNRVPFGVPGEFYVGGHGLSRCYCNKPRLTAERFVPDAVSGEHGSRLYRSGDVVAMRWDKRIMFLGRRDNLVKIHGFRVELGEVENKLMAHEDVGNVAVLVREHLGDKTIVAYVTPAEHMTAEGLIVENLAHHAMANLPNFMVPAAFVVMEKLPLTHNGKLNRRALPEPVYHTLAEDYVAPVTQVQEILCSLWAEVLSVPRVGIKDSFFELGGHSLLGTRVLFAVFEAFRVRIDLWSLFDNPVLEFFAEKIERALLKDDHVEERKLQPLSRDILVPLSFEQRRLWFFDQLNPNNTVYLVPMMIRMHGSLKREALQQALTWLCARHQILHTAYRGVDGKPMQILERPKALELPLEDLSEEDPATLQDRLRLIKEREAGEPLDLTVSPQMRLRLIRLSECEHLLALTLHHIVVDGTATVILLRELSVAYAAFAEGKTPALKPLNIHYREYAADQARHFESEQENKHLDYWRTQLEGAENLNLPSDRPHPKVLSYNGKRSALDLGPELSGKVKTLANEQKVSLFMVMLSAWQVLLSRFSGQTDFIIGSPIEKRDRLELAGVLGYLSDIMPMRADLSADPSFAALLQQNRKAALEAYSNHMALDRLVSKLNIERVSNRHPLYQAAFGLNPPVESVLVGGISFTPEHNYESHVSTVDLTLQLSDMSDGLKGYIEYCTDLFNSDRIARMMQCLVALMEAVIQDPKRPISRLNLFGDGDRDLLNRWNETAEPYPKETCAHHLFSEVVGMHSERTALVFQGESLSYGELDQRANRLANYLRARGIGPEKIVAILLERGMDQVICALGILKAGGAFLPMDPAYPDERLASMIEDSGASLVFTTGNTSPRLSRYADKLVCVDRERGNFSSQSDQDPQVKVDPLGLAYVIYTSGSTGVPKGVQIFHRGLCCLVTTTGKFLGIDETQRILLFTSFSFDVAVWDIFMALTNRAELHLIPEETATNPDLLAVYLKQAQISIVTLPPSIQTVLPEDCDLGLRVMLTAGEATSRKLVSRFTKSMRYVNAYGPTECTVCSTWTTLEQSDTEPSIGKPLDNVEIFLLDRHMERAPIGTIAEIYIGGDGVGRGYHDRAGLTASVYVPHPFSDKPGTRLYRVGDLGVYRADGDIEFHGRNDRQVKLRGFRIELGEIEACLSNAPRIANAAAVIRKLSGGEKTLAAYLEVEPGTNPDVAAIREHVTALLPNYMVPASFTFLEVLPTTPNGKLNRKALPDPDMGGPGDETCYVSPEGETELVLAQVWSEVLNGTKVGRNDNFFHLGGDSILAIQMVVKLRRHGLVLTPNQVFLNQGLEEMALACEQGELLPIQGGTAEGEAPLLPVQSWFFETVTVDRHHWNQALLLTVEDSVDPKRVTSAMHSLCNHHDALRLRYRETEHGWVQTYARPGDDHFAMDHFDFRSLGEEDLSKSIEAAADQVQAGLHLEYGPLLRAGWFKTPDGQPDKMLLVAHHLVVDGVSWRIIFEELNHLHGQIAAGEEPDPLSKTHAYGAWGDRLRAHTESSALQSEADFWLEQMRSGPALPVDVDGQENTVADKETISSFLDPEQTHDLLHQVGNSPRQSIDEVLITSLVRALRTRTGQSSLYLNLEGHGREDLIDNVDVTRTVGWFTSVWPLTLDIGSSQDPIASLKQVKTRTRAVPNKGLSYGLLRYMDPNPELRARFGKFPDPQISFNYLGRFDQSVREGAPFVFSTETAGHAQSPGGPRTHLIDVYALVTQGRLKVSWDFCTRIHHRDTIKAVAASFLEEIHGLIQACLKVESFAPSDFGLTDTDQDSLEAALEDIDL